MSCIGEKVLYRNNIENMEFNIKMNKGLLKEVKGKLEFNDFNHTALNTEKHVNMQVVYHNQKELSNIQIHRINYLNSDVKYTDKFKLTYNIKNKLI